MSTMPSFIHVSQFSITPKAVRESRGKVYALPTADRTWLIVSIYGLGACLKVTWHENYDYLIQKNS